MKVWVNGTFDVLHLGHIRLLKYAASLGELLVGVDTDDRVKRLKGSTRPFNNLQERIEMLKALKFVNQVVSFSTDDELTAHIKNWNTDIMGECLKQVIYITMIDGKSTTKILSYNQTIN
jgi:D-beta-D-heptose 7-phosphate kinase/D-beta-D-heptose 1-phosphate adenosyltransferase